METDKQVLEPASSVDGDTDGEISGLIRRVRRRAKLSQRELAHELGVSQSAIAKWETGRTSPTARMLIKVLELGELHLVAVGANGDQVPPMAQVAGRDAAERRYPAHTFVWAEGWWAPEGAEMTAWFTSILARSADLELPKVTYSRRWGPPRPPTLADLRDHPTWPELVAEAKEGWQPPRRARVPLPRCAFADTRKSRNRQPEEFGHAARGEPR
jgi:HTH-type transcriptional regulator/antitoxin HipB